MARRLVATVLSLFLVGLAGKALANSETEAASPPGVVDIFGKTLCLAAAPADAACDWRIPKLESEAAAEPAPLSLSLFGLRWCLSDRPTGDCVNAASEDRSFEIFGVRIPVPEAR